MFQQGLYKIAYRSLDTKTPETGSALAILRDGKILGSDPNGGVFMGTYAFDLARALSHVELQIDVPPGGELITGFLGGTQGATLNVDGHFQSPNANSKAIINVGSGRIEVELSYLGPLPD